MLHILFLILKIIGIILLAILGILILLLCVVLFVPVQYRFQAETQQGVEKLELHGKATWLFRLATAYVDYSNKKLDWQVRVLWKKKQSSEPDKDAVIDDVETEEPQVSYTKTEKTESQTADTTREESGKQRKSKQKSKKPKKPNFVEKIRYTIREICDKIKEILEKKDRIVEYISDEIHQAAFGRVTKETMGLIRRLRPKKVKGMVRFGLKEPYDTGRVLALLSVLYPFYGENIKIYPEFEQEVLEGSVVIKGRAHLFPFVVTICKLFLDENVKTAYKNFRRK